MNPTRGNNCPKWNPLSPPRAAQCSNSRLVQKNLVSRPLAQIARTYRKCQISCSEISFPPRGGKGHKDRQVMLPDALREVLAAFLRRKRPTDWFFPGGKAGPPISEKAVFLTCGKAARSAGIAHTVAPERDQRSDSKVLPTIRAS